MVALIIAVGGKIAFWLYRKSLRQKKKYSFLLLKKMSS